MVAGCGGCAARFMARSGFGRSVMIAMVGGCSRGLYLCHVEEQSMAVGFDEVPVLYSPHNYRPVS